MPLIKAELPISRKEQIQSSPTATGESNAFSKARKAILKFNNSGIFCSIFAKVEVARHVAEHNVWLYAQSYQTWQPHCDIVKLLLQLLTKKNFQLLTPSNSDCFPIFL